MLDAATLDAGVIDGADRLESVIAAELAPIVGQIDHEGLYPAQAMSALGEAGLFRDHLAAFSAAPSIAAATRKMAMVGRICMSTAFCTWCQDAAGWYLEQSDNTALREALQPGLARGEKMGGTGLSNPMKSFAGIETLKLRARRVAGGYEVSGVLPWVSNLGPDHLFGTVFEVADTPGHRVMAMFRCGHDGVEIRQNAVFVALEGTGTYSVLFRRAFIRDEQVLADPLGEMVKRIKAGFILLQAGMGMGVAAGCIDLMRDSDTTHRHSNQYLAKGAEDYAAELAEIGLELDRLGATPLEQAPEYMRAVLTLRLRVSELALEAAQAAMLHAGSRGYILGSPVNRRIREAQFAAIITPSVRHLRQELHRMDDRAAVH